MEKQLFSAKVGAIYTPTVAEVEALSAKDVVDESGTSKDGGESGASTTPKDGDVKVPFEWVTGVRFAKITGPEILERIQEGKGVSFSALRSSQEGSSTVDPMHKY